MSILNSIREFLPVRDPVLVFALAMWVILLAPLIARRFKLPDIIGLILAGLMLGEHGLNILARDDTMILLGTVGLLYIMFLAGLEVDLFLFFQQKLNSVVFGLMTFVIPMILGTLMALGILSFSWPAAILLASMFASHTLVGYPVVTRLGITRNPAVIATIGGTIITDTLALLVLAVIAASAAGDLTFWFWIQTASALLVFGAIIFMGIPPLARVYFHKYSDQGARDFVFVLAVAYLASYLAFLAGLEAIIGAFLGGLALNQSIPSQSSLMQRVHFAGQALFVPFFLISVGMLVDIRLIFSSWHVWLVGGGMVLTVIITKWLAAMATQRLLKFSPEEGRVMYGLSVTQAAATLAAVFVGYRIGLFDEEVLNGAILMILVTCVVGPAYVERFGREVALHEESSPLRPGDSPLRILIPLANPASAPALLDLAFLIRRPHSPEPVYPLTVADPGGDVARQVAEGERMLGHAVLYAAGAGVPVQPATRIDTNIANGITRAIAELRISTVVIGWTGAPSRRRQALGKVLDQLLRDNRLAVIVCRLSRPINTSPRLILLVPPLIEREAGFGEAIRTVKVMASRLSARLHVVAAADESRRLETQIKPVRPVHPTTFHALPGDAILDGEIPLAPIEPEDLLVLLHIREGRLAWTPELRDLPGRLVEQHPDNNLVLFYPAEYPEDTDYGKGAIGLLDPARAFLGLPASGFHEAVERCLVAHPGAPEHRKMIQDALVRQAREYSTEIAPGVVLVHTHVPDEAEPVLYLATSREGFNVPLIQNPVRVVLLLISPVGWPAAEHLRNLAGLARLMGGDQLAERLSAADTFSGIREQLQGNEL